MLSEALKRRRGAWCGKGCSPGSPCGTSSVWPLARQASGPPLTGARHNTNTHTSTECPRLKGWPLHHVQHMLGHENLSQTSTYLNATRMGLRESMQRFDDSAPRCNPVAIAADIEPPLNCNEQPTERLKDNLH